jgi:hypothetical protein
MDVLYKSRLRLYAVAVKKIEKYLDGDAHADCMTDASMDALNLILNELNMHLQYVGRQRKE